MHAFVGNHLVVMDPFALTRVTLPNKVKTNKKVNGEFLVANGTLLVGHSRPRNRRFAMTVPELKVIPIDDEWNYNLTYHETMAVTHTGLPIDVEPEALVIFNLAGKEKARLAIPKTKPRGKADLGPGWPALVTHETRIAVGGDGSFVVLADGRLWGGRLTGGKKTAIVEPWSITLDRPQGLHQLKAGAFGAFAAAFHPALGKAYCVLVANGTITQRVVECIGPVDFDGANIAYQASPTQIGRVPIAGGDVEAFELPSSAHGPGSVMADGEHLLFLTPDHERILDVVGDEAIDRGLPAAERAQRTQLLTFIERYRAPAAVANLHVYLASLHPAAYGEGPRPSWTWTEGDHSLLRLIVIGNVVTASYSDSELGTSGHSPPQELALVTEAEVRRTFEAIDAHGLDLLAGLSTVEHPLEWHLDTNCSDPLKRKGKPLFDRAAAQMMLWAIIECRAAKKQPKLAPKAAKWAKQPLTAKQLIAKIDPSITWQRGTHMTDAQTAVGLLIIDYLGADADDVLIDWYLERPHVNIDSDPFEIFAKLYPKRRKALIAKVATYKSETATRLRQYIPD